MGYRHSSCAPAGASIFLFLPPKAASLHRADTNISAVTWEWSQKIDPPKEQCRNNKKIIFQDEVSRQLNTSGLL